MLDIFQKFSNHSKNALKNALSLALNCGHKTITPPHILYGLVQQKGSIAGQILVKTKIESEEIKKALISKTPGQEAITQISFSPLTKKLLEKAFLIANQNHHQYIGTEHLLASILMINDDLIIELFKEKNIDLSNIKRQLETILNSTSKFPDLIDSLNYLNEEPKENSGYANFFQPALNNQPSALEVFATKLTDTAIQKKIDPVIGRQDEINRLIQILCRRNKNNPLLLGDPGVGKTAIVEGLAKKISQHDVPEILKNKIIYTLDLSLLVAGTSFRGEFENRLKQIINEVKKNPNIILFIDEIHNIIGAGSATGSMDAASILKPALARGEIRCIGATTPEDYKKNIENDPALERRFQPIIVNQPNVEKTIEILQGIKNNYETFHQVKISSEAIVAASQLSERYITDRFLPDKAIDLIDEAASAKKVKYANNPIVKEFEELENQLAGLADKKQAAVSQEKFSLARKYQKDGQEILNKIEEIKKSNLSQKPKSLAEITKNDITKIVSKTTGIPLADLILTEKKRLLNLEKLLAKKIIGQTQALKLVAEFIRRSRAGIADINRPIGSFMFLGPSGVGKTELAKILAEIIFGEPAALIKIDMSEFAESFNISKLIGAPAGYIGYKEKTKLTDSVKRRPYSLVLFDEIEKAHFQVFNLLLQILEDGSLTDATGKKINFKNTIIIMTSNLGSENFNQQAKLGFQATKDEKIEIEKNLEGIENEVLKKLKDKFPPEFLSRIDKTIVFNPLTAKVLFQITRLQLDELKKRLAKQGLKIKFEPKIVPFIANLSYSPESGARAVRKTIQELIENKIAEKILSHKKSRQEISIRLKNNKIII